MLQLPISQNASGTNCDIMVWCGDQATSDAQEKPRTGGGGRVSGVGL